MSNPETWKTSRPPWRQYWTALPHIPQTPRSAKPIVIHRSGNKDNEIVSEEETITFSFPFKKAPWSTASSYRQARASSSRWGHKTSTCFSTIAWRFFSCPSEGRLKARCTHAVAPPWDPTPAPASSPTADVRVGADRRQRLATTSESARRRPLCCGNLAIESAAGDVVAAADPAP